MPLPLPNLDDRTYADLVEEARALIPTYMPGWTNHNPSDAGITLIELFAYLTEMLLYRTNRITDANQVAFLKLLRGPTWEPSPNPVQRAAEIQETILDLRRPYRAVTCADFESLAVAVDPKTIARARCVPRRNLKDDPTNMTTDKPGHISVIIVPSSTEGDSHPQPTPEQIEAVDRDLDQRRLLTTQVHVVGPGYVPVGIQITLVLKRGVAEDQFLFSIDPAFEADLNQTGKLTDALRQALAHANQNPLTLDDAATVLTLEPNLRWLITDPGAVQTYTVRSEKDDKNNVTLNIYRDIVRAQAMQALQRYFDPLQGGRAETGWPFGRNVYVSEVYQLLDTLSDVDYVTKTDNSNNSDEITTAAGHRRLTVKKTVNGEIKEVLTAIKIEDNELVNAQIRGQDITIITRA